MSLLRFKTKEEFIRDGLWNDEYETPFTWNCKQLMNEFIGEPIDDSIEYIESQDVFKYKGWTFVSSQITCS